MRLFIHGLLFFPLFILGSCFTVEPELRNLHLAYENQIRSFEDQIKQKNNLLTNSKDLSSQVLFYLYSRDADTYDILSLGDNSLLNRSHFDPKKPTKVLIHGWMDYVHGEMITSLKQAFLNGEEDVNILAVDWGDVSIDVNYLAAVAKIGAVGRYVADMLDFLVASGAPVESFHVLGHSLGAHVAGVVGVSLTSGKLSRISGLDPALPGFGPLTLERRLQKTDAEFVDCIHTCGGMLGIMDPICQADFYPNGGKFAQPGCSSLDFGRCSHFRAFVFFAESISPGHKFPALTCDSIHSSNRKCNRSPFLMGYPLDPKARGSFYVHTNSKYPFAGITEQ